MDLFRGSASRALSFAANFKWWYRTGRSLAAGQGYSIAGPGSQRIEDDSNQAAVYGHVGQRRRELLGRHDSLHQRARIEC